MESRKPKRATRKTTVETAAVSAEPVKAAKTTRTRKPKACAPVTPAETEIVAATPIAVTESTPVEAPAPATMAAAVAAGAETPVPVTAAAPVAPEVRAEEVAELAYHLWVSRGCPMGSPDEDWLRAEEKLRQSRKLVAV